MSIFRWILRLIAGQLPSRDAEAKRIAEELAHKYFMAPNCQQPLQAIAKTMLQFYPSEHVYSQLDTLFDAQLPF